MQDTITIRRPDDWHCHLRDEEFLSRTVLDMSQRFGRAIVMPNLDVPVTTVDLARRYHERIAQHIPDGSNFHPLMTLYLTEQLTPETLEAARDMPELVAVKLYPAGATTNSKAGVRELKRIYPLLEVMQELDLVLCIHGEVNDPDTDVFDREKEFIENALAPMLQHFPKLRIVLEHISTATAVDFVKDGPDNLAATITAHHLWFDRNNLLRGGIRPHYYCLPILKRSTDREALCKAATSGNAKFFLGTDSAPHVQSRKESACGCAGIYTAHAAIEMYTQLFSDLDALDKLENFASVYGAQFYGFEPHSEIITLEKNPWQVPEVLDFGSQTLIPCLAGDYLQWQLQNDL